MSAKDLDKAELFYTKILGGEIVRRVTPTEEQLKAGRLDLRATVAATTQPRSCLKKVFSCCTKST